MKAIYLSIISLALQFSSAALLAQGSRSGVSASIEKRVQRVIELTNQERGKRGLPPLKRQDNLSQAASWMSENMAQHSYFAHEDKMGRSVRVRLTDFGYQKFRAIAENIAAGQTAPTDVLAAWIKSPNHSANLFSPAFREIGVGYVAAPNTSYECYWVQDFGTRRDIYPIVINEERAETDTSRVNLYIYGEEWATLMRISNDGANWTKWEPFAPEKEWDLEPGTGTKTVYVELKNQEGDTLTSEDTIKVIEKSSTAPMGKPMRNGSGETSGGGTTRPKPRNGTEDSGDAIKPAPAKPAPREVDTPPKNPPKKEEMKGEEEPKKEAPPKPPKEEPAPSKPPKKEPPPKGNPEQEPKKEEPKKEEPKKPPQGDAEEEPKKPPKEPIPE